jgi:hypothetical protein
MCADDQETKEFPPMLVKQQAYTWKRGSTWGVGTKAVDIRGSVIVGYGGPLTTEDGSTYDVQVAMTLMKHSHTGELEWVANGMLDLYPPNNTPIETP